MPAPKGPIVLFVEHGKGVRTYYQENFGARILGQKIVMVPHVAGAIQKLQRATLSAAIIEGDARRSAQPDFELPLDRLEQNTVRLAEYIRSGGFTGPIIIVAHRDEERQFLVSMTHSLALTVVGHPRDVLPALSQLVNAA